MSEEMCPFCEEWCGKELADDLRKYDATIPRWISVEDRLPEMGTKVLIYLPCFEYDPIELGYLEKAGEHLRWITGGDSWERLDLCTHWMPLPEPPK